MTAKYGYIGYGPDTSPIVVAKQVFSPTGVQTNFTFAAGYQIGYLDVYLNGARQIEGQDFNATDTSTVGLTTAAQSGDVLELVAYKAYNLAAPSAVGNFNVGGNLTVTGNESVSTLVATTAIGIGSTYTTSTTLPYQLTVTAPGATSTPSLSYCISDFSNNIDGYSQVNIRNANTGSSASGDLVITADNGTDTTNFIDLGVNNTGFNDAAWTINGALDGYLYSSNQNLSIGVAFTNRYLSFFAGGTLSANEKMRITNTGVGIGTTNTSNILQVGTGITFTASGINVTGIVTSSSFNSNSSTVSGISSVGTLSVSGNASIGTVNSIGIITAQQGIQILANGIGIVGVSTFNGNLIFNQFANEKVNIVAGTANGNTNIDLITNGSVHYFTSNSTATWTPNFRASSAVTLDSVMSTGQVVTATVISTQNNTAYYAAAINVDGSSRTIYWSGGTAPTAGSSSGVDMYTYSIVKTASNTFTVFGSISQYA